MNTELIKKLQTIIDSSFDWISPDQQDVIGQAIKEIKKTPSEADIDRALKACIPGGSYARDWFLSHESERGRENVRDVVRRMLQTYK